VFITGRGKDALDAAAAEIGKNVMAVQGDVANLSDLDRLYDTIKKHNRQIDIIFANAGLAKLAQFGTVAVVNFDGDVSTLLAKRSLCPRTQNPCSRGRICLTNSLRRT
jgi:NADP-dependent 3-hydroxy acid dehydrogenase YdfG